MKIFTFLFTFLFLTALSSNAIERRLSADIIEGQNTAKNLFVSNGSGQSSHFETTVGNWLGFADAAASTPVDLTGGSPTLTCTRTTSSPLSGVGSFLITKDAANRQGNGCSMSVTVPTNGKGKVLRGTFIYSIASGTYADNDIDMWVYDQTNAVLIQPTPYHLKNHGLTSEQMSFEFQTSTNGSAYTIGFYVASTSASAYTVKVDDIKLSISTDVSKSYGSPVTDWVSYTPTGSWSANTTYTGQYRRVGDSAEIDFNIALAGAPTSASLTLNLPSVCTIDTAKLSSTTSANRNIMGTGNTLTATGTLSYPIGYWYSSTTAVAINTLTGASANNNAAAITQAVPGTYASGDFVRGTFKVPCVGWSSSVVMSSDADTRVVAMYAASQVPTGTISGSMSVAKFGTVTKDTHAGYNTSTGLYTVPVPGWYDVKAQVEISGTSTTTDQYGRIALYQNGAAVTYGSQISGGAYAINFVPGFAITVYCNAGDTLAVYAGSSITSPIYGSGVAQSSFSINRVSGPAQIAASESVSALYTGAPPTGTLTNAYNTTTFGTKVKDTHNAYASGTYTVPVSGTYSISAQIGTSATTFTNGNLTSVGIYVDGVQKYAGVVDSTVSALTYYPTVTALSIPLLAGQLVTIKSYNDGVTPAWSGSAAVNWFSITRTGNY